MGKGQDPLLIRFYVGKTLELIGITSVGVGLLIGGVFPGKIGSPERAMSVELLFFGMGVGFFLAGRWIERRS